MAEAELPSAATKKTGAGRLSPGSQTRPAGRVPIRAKAVPRHDAPHARIYTHWLAAPAWSTLSAQAKVLLTVLLARYRPQNPNLFLLSDRRAADLVGCSPNAASKAVQQLAERGWIIIERHGGVSGARATRSRQVSLAAYDTETRVGDRDAPLFWGSE